MSKSKWIRNQTSEAEREKVTFYVNPEEDPHIADWIRSIPYGKTGKQIRTAIDFYLEYGQSVMSDKTPSRRKQSVRRAISIPPVDAGRKTAPDLSQNLVPAPISTPAVTPVVNSNPLQPTALESKNTASDSVLDSEEQEANSLDDIDPQTLALQMELANRFSF